jgi:murein DD-endopeptidase MepM/ murein hydrolase activator NlpD
MAMASVGGLTAAEAQTPVGTTYSQTSDVALQAVQLDGQLSQLRKAAQEREVRASRERVRRALVERQRKEAAERKRKEAEARAKAVAERLKKEKQELARLAGLYVSPLRNYRLTASFGASSGLWSSTHTGQDFAAPSGTPVRAVTKGVVTSAEWAGAYGWRVIIRHADGTETWYCHLSSFAVRGGTVQTGETIGRVGSTGNTTGPHLHFEVRRQGVPISPLAWLRAHGVRI